MNSYPTRNIRSFALVGHGGCGKTSVGEAIAWMCDQNNRLGSVAEGTSILDFEQEEHKRGGSVSTSFLTVEFDGYKLHIADTPGDGNFLHEARVSLQAMDGAVVVISAPDGVEVSTEQISAHAGKLGIPRSVFINKMDRENNNYREVVQEIKDVLGFTAVPIQLPLGEGHDFCGVVDLVNRTAWRYDGDKGHGVEGEIPAEMSDAVQSAIEILTDVVAEQDDDLIEKYLEEGELTQEELRAGLMRAVADGRIVPVMFGSATSNIGVDRLLWAARAFPSAGSRAPVVGHLPDSEDEAVARPADPNGPFSALCIKTLIDRVGHISVFRCLSGSGSDLHLVNPRTGGAERLHGFQHLVGKKGIAVSSVVPGDIFAVSKLRDTHTGDTVCDEAAQVVLPWHPPRAPMLAFTVKPKSRSDVDKLKVALTRLQEEDIGLRQSFDEVTKELVLSGMGASHVHISVEKLERKYGVHVELGTPSIPYRESIGGSADVRYRHKKQTGGAGQFGEVAIRVRPNDRDAGIDFVNSISGGVIPTSLIPSVEKGVRDQLQRGVLCGYPMVDVVVELYDGKYHPVDSKDIAFQIAGRHAVQEAALDARPGLLEPIYLVEVVAPESMVGDVMGDLNTRRARIQSMETRGRSAVVKALVPLAEIQSYAPELRSITGGKGSYSMSASGYEAVPTHLLDKLVDEIKREHHHED